MREFHRRSTPQDSPLVPSLGEIYDFSREWFRRERECGCYESCLDPQVAALTPAEVDPAHYPPGAWSYRWSFSVTAADPRFSFASGSHLLTWSGSEWTSGPLVGPCPGDDPEGEATYHWRLRSTSDDLAAGTVRLELVRLGGAGECSAWVDLCFASVHPFDPLCGNLFRASARSRVAAYSAGLSCTICVSPAQIWVETTCLGEELLVPAVLGLPRPFGTGPSACPVPPEFDAGLFLSLSGGCGWDWSRDDWAATCTIVDAGSGQVRLHLALVFDGGGSGTNTWNYQSDAVPLAELTDRLADPWPLALQSIDGPRPTLCDFDVDQDGLRLRDPMIVVPA